jgi:hypothetical protein
VTTKAKELIANPRAAQPYRAPDMTGRITHSEVWAIMQRNAAVNGTAKVWFDGDTANVR